MARTEPTTDRLRTCKESDDVFTDVVQPEMRKIAVEVLQAARDSIEHRKNSWELYGYDFMVDAELRPWLIEVNSSPACDYSTAVTERYVKKALVDILKVTIDKREWERTPVGDEPDTGGWQLAHKGPFVETPIASLTGGDIYAEGKKVEAPRAIRASSSPRRRPRSPRSGCGRSGSGAVAERHGGEAAALAEKRRRHGGARRFPRTTARRRSPRPPQSPPPRRGSSRRRRRPHRARSSPCR